ncbi:MAG TPA: UvrD-helicase domain-containing protein [Leptospiraceae bacterium]|nr:UvrD-helicase domain-containing protein [Leptospiraceae bacterium]HMX32697.1 UvrD-helicase domain-containing protein [Leptospiraceae bacterium]HMY32715.1 UvrD-helicase domain-containing protein [Leptospiraceae bacterium]HMZ62523.1 UvrD-helicase domain-containing protein [Leptospiraceae bacterium]HNA05755.1 UvrD-helicase domain-containing protein [Leptospiraceae bacterium]
MKYSLEQEKILEDESNFKQVIAAAGSGKTSTMIALLEKIILEKKEEPMRILVITFSRKAVGEIKERLEKRVGHQEIRIQTFHAYCLYILQKYHPQFKDVNIQIIEPNEKESILKEYFKRERFTVGGIPYDFLLSNTGNFLEKNFPSLAIEVNTAYALYKKEKNKLDFDDLVEIYLNGLRKKEDWAILARQEVSRVIVDEFQDTDLTQLEWLRLLSPDKLCVVGDDWQAIYGFRGASTEPFLKFKDFFNPCSIHFLTTNYRSLPEVIETSAIPIGKNKKNIKKKVRPFREGKAKVYKIYIDEEQSLESLCRNIREKAAIDSDLMVLCRSNYRIQALINLGVPEKNIMTIHASKGLEFKTVFVDLHSGWNLKIEEEPDIIEEERRILYVALSRAKDNLYIFGNRKFRKKLIEDNFFSYFRFTVSECKLANLK